MNTLLQRGRLALTLGAVVLALGGSALALQSGAQQEPTDQSTVAPAKSVESLLVRSRIEYLANPRFPQVLEALYVGSELARWNRRILNGQAHDRDCLFRDVDSIHHLAQGSWTATRWSEANRDSGTLAFELRRATLLWPVGFAWQAGAEVGTPSERVTRIVRAGREETPEKLLGQLVATLDDTGFPTSMHSVSPDGTTQETLLIRSWSDRDGFRWPLEMSLVVAGERIWDERIETVQNAKILVVPEFFLPPNLRPQPDTSGGPKLLNLDLLGFTFKRLDLPSDKRDWEAAFVWGKQQIRRVADDRRARSLPHDIDSSINFELNSKGQPLALLVRLTIPVLPAPAGWHTEHDRPGVATIVQSTEQLTAGLLARLRLKRDRSYNLAAPYAKIIDSPTGRRVSVYQPLIR